MSFSEKRISRSHCCPAANRRNTSRAVCQSLLISDPIPEWNTPLTKPGIAGLPQRSRQQLSDLISLSAHLTPSNLPELSHWPRRQRTTGITRTKNTHSDRLIWQFKSQTSFQRHCWSITSPFILHPRLVPWLRRSVKHVLLLLKGHAMMAMRPLFKLGSLRTVSTRQIYIYRNGK